MAGYLDPKADVCFKKVFGSNDRLLMSFLNAMLPLGEREIVALTYLPNENTPNTPEKKRTIADVRCTDNHGRVFIVEMQIVWLENFKLRMLFEASDAYVAQLKRGENYRTLQPVYGLALLGSDFSPSESWYHHYQLVDRGTMPEDIIEHLQLVFIELQKFPVVSKTDKQFRILWLRFMREIDQRTEVVPPELLAVPEIKEALHLLETSAYSEGEMAAYKDYWDAISWEKTAISEGESRGKEIAVKEMALKLRNAGVAISVIQSCTDLSEVEILSLKETS